MHAHPSAAPAPVPQRPRPSVASGGAPTHPTQQNEQHGASLPAKRENKQPKQSKEYHRMKRMRNKQKHQALLARECTLAAEINELLQLQASLEASNANLRAMAAAKKAALAQPPCTAEQCDHSTVKFETTCETTFTKSDLEHFAQSEDELEEEAMDKFENEFIDEFDADVEAAHARQFTTITAFATTQWLTRHAQWLWDFLPIPTADQCWIEKDTSRIFEHLRKLSSHNPMLREIVAEYDSVQPNLEEACADFLQSDQHEVSIKIEKDLMGGFSTTTPPTSPEKGVRASITPATRARLTTARGRSRLSPHRLDLS